MKFKIKYGKHTVKFNELKNKCSCSKYYFNYDTGHETRKVCISCNSAIVDTQLIHDYFTPNFYTVLLESYNKALKKRRKTLCNEIDKL